ncbi:MAG: Glu/Leu/Phe/Val dehydrogenase dimerization domain-containing protein [Aquisalimonadaceae bacterium]
MDIFDNPDFDNHEHVAFGYDPGTGLRAVIAVHNTFLGPGLGGLRMWPYGSVAEAVGDVLRLSRGMTYKNAMAGLNLGGGKAVIIGDPKRDRTPALMRAMGHFVDRLGGLYITAEDSGISVEDLRHLAECTDHVTGLHAGHDADGAERSGDPSPATALGVFEGMRACARRVHGTDSVSGMTVAIQGLGSVGYRLAGNLHAAGAELVVSDINPLAVERAGIEFGARAAAPERIHAVECEIYAPCALGGAINDVTLRDLKAGIVAGAANNQLTRPEHGLALHERGVLYAPDYVINAGGVIDVAAQRGEYDAADVRRRVLGIAETLMDVFERAERSGERPELVADRMAEERFGRRQAGFS